MVRKLDIILKYPCLILATGPLPPANLAVDDQQATSTSVTVTWDTPSGTLDLFEIEYSRESGPRTSVGFVEADVNAYTVENLLPGTTYNVFVTTVAGRGSTTVKSEAATVPADTSMYAVDSLDQFKPHTNSNKSCMAI